MKRVFAFVVFFFAFLSAFCQERELIRRNLYVLASDSLQGRAAGASEGARAREYISKQLDDAGLDVYHQSFKVGEKTYTNIVSLYPAAQPSNEYIIVGAHYDHLGIKNKNGVKKIYHGADDNASGTAALISLARKLSQNKPSLDRNIILVAFDAEEIGLFGSQHFAKVPLFMQDLQQVKLMVNMDMVGWLKDGHLSITGTGMIGNWDALFGRTRHDALDIKTKRFDNYVMTDTDYTSFAKKGVASLTLTTGLKSPYHKPEDTAEKIDYAGLEKVSDFVYSLICEAANDEDLGYSGKCAARHRKTTVPFSFGLGANLGSVWQTYHFGNMTGRSARGFGLGAFVQYNKMKLFGAGSEAFALRLGAEYQSERVRRAEGTATLAKLSVPLALVIQTPLQQSLGANIGFGFYYDRVLFGDFPAPNLTIDNFNRDDIGFVFGLEVRIARFGFSYVGKTGFVNQNKGSDDRITSSSSMFKLTYYFNR